MIEEKKEGGLLSGFVNAIRKLSIRPADGDLGLLRMPSRLGPSTSLTIREEDEDDEDEPPLPVVAMRPLYESSNDTIAAPRSIVTATVGGTFSRFWRRMNNAINPWSTGGEEVTPGEVSRASIVSKRRANSRVSQDMPPGLRNRRRGSIVDGPAQLGSLIEFFQLSK